MSLNDRDKQALIELVNNIQQAFFSGEPLASGNSGKIALPCRFIRSAAEVLEHSYSSETVTGLDVSELELLLTHLARATDAVAGSLDHVISALPEYTPPGVQGKLAASVATLKAIKQKREVLFASAQSILDAETQIEEEQHKLHDLQTRHQLLQQTQEQLRVVNLEDLRAEVARLQGELGPSGDELAQLQAEISARQPELEAITMAIADARSRLDTIDQQLGEQPALISLCTDLLTALEPYLASSERGIKAAASALAEKTSEGRELEHQLSTRITEVSKVCEETSQLAAALKLYAESDHELSRNIPTVMNVTRERLTCIEEQLQETDNELRLALERHQRAKHVAQNTGQGV